MKKKKLSKKEQSLAHITKGLVYITLSDLSCKSGHELSDTGWGENC